MNERTDSGDANVATVSVWTPWGEQKVMRADKRTSMRRSHARQRRGDEGVMPQSLAENAFAEGRA